MRDCKHVNTVKLPYSGELCLECRVILIDDEFDKGMTKERFLAIKRVLWNNYKGPWVDQWYLSYRFVNVNETPRRCGHTTIRELPYSGRLCVDCHVVLIDDEFAKNMTRKRHGDLIRALSDLPGYWDYKFFNVNDSSSVEITCGHMRRENIEGTTFCVKCGLKTNEVTYQNEYDDSHFFQGRCGYPVVTPDVLETMRENLPTGRVSKHDVRDMLKKTKLQRYNKYVHRVHYLLTGVPKNDISQYEDVLMGEMDYITGQFMIRERSLNKQYLTMLLVESHGEKYDRSEFFFPKSMEKYESALVKIIGEL